MGLTMNDSYRFFSADGAFEYVVFTLSLNSAETKQVEKSMKVLLKSLALLDGPSKGLVSLSSVYAVIGAMQDMMLALGD